MNEWIVSLKTFHLNVCSYFNYYGLFFPHLIQFLASSYFSMLVCNFAVNRVGS
jgi:hypothetical protein